MAWLLQQIQQNLSSKTNKTKTKKDKAFLHHTGALFKKTGPEFPRGLFYFIFSFLFFFHCLAFKFSYGVPRSDTRITAWHTYNNNKANEGMNCMSGTRPDGIAIFFYLFLQWRELWHMVGWCGVIFTSFSIIDFFHVVRIGQDSLGYDFN